MRTDRLSGGCLCGAVRYRCSADPVGTVNCHCRDCQKTSGAAHVSYFVMPAGAFTHDGPVLVFRNQAASGAQRNSVSCKECGSYVFGFSEATGLMAVTAASLDDSSWFKPAVNIFGAHRRSWDPIDETLPTFDAMPPAANPGDDARS